MRDSRLVFGSTLLLFGMLWLPLGQYDFLIDHWMKIGTYAVPFLLIGVFSFSTRDHSKNRIQQFRFIGVLLLIAYIIHQFEEHWVDLYGNYYAFYDFNNDFIRSNLGASDSTVIPLTKEAIFMINTSLVWLVGALAIWFSPRNRFPLIAMGSIIVVNGFVHILAGLIKLQYNPGLVTSIIIFLPLYFWFVNYLLKRSKSYKPQILGGLAWAFLAHVIMVAGLLMANWFHLFPELVYFIVLIIWSILPVFLFRKQPVIE